MNTQRLQNAQFLIVTLTVHTLTTRLQEAWPERRVACILKKNLHKTERYAGYLGLCYKDAKLDGFPPPTP